MRNKFITTLATAFSLGCLSTGNFALAGQADLLAEQFHNPPHSARPHTWWHWMNGNVTKEGIEKDLRWMSRVGLGGLQHFDANLSTPQIVENRLIYMEPDWQDAFKYAVQLADELDLEVAIAASPGWSETGGPWVEPGDGMKKLVWNELRIKGGETFSGQIPAPPTTTGAFQDLSFHDPLPGSADHGELPIYYKDIAILAYPVNTADLPVPTAQSGHGNDLNVTPLMDNRFSTIEKLPRAENDPNPVLIYDYGEPVTIRSATLFIPNARPPFREPRYLPKLEARIDGNWQSIADLELTEVPTTVSFSAVRSNKFRLVFADNPKTRPGLGDGAPGALAPDIFASEEKPFIAIGQWQLYSEAKVNRVEAKAGYATVLDYYALGIGPGNSEKVVAPKDVINLTPYFKNNSLNWQAPNGSDWRIVRLGYSLTGKMNHPAPPEATGLEVDKFDGAAVRRYLKTYLSMYLDAAGKNMVGKHGLRSLLTDSIEVGAANWTHDLPDKFKKLRGYDLTPWLPALTGAVIGTPEQSEAFLYDFRRTLADLLVSEHYGTVAEVARKHGMKVYGEALEDQRPLLGDDMAMRAHTSIPMAALWTYSRGASPRPTLLGDMKGASSVAHVYGQNLAAAESMTSAFSPWAFAPYDLKRIIDLEFAYGINRPVIHTSVHQPVDDKKPGLSLMIFGQYFNRHETWADMARPWIDYIARSSFLLQQGRNVADVAYFYGEEAPITALFATAPPADLPNKYAYDFVNADVLLNQLSVDKGELVAKSGARYKVLYLGGSSQRMTVPTLRRIAELAKAGATIIGQPPVSSPSLADDTSEFNKLVHQLWHGNTTKVGLGRVIASNDINAELSRLGIRPDFDYESPSTTESEILFVHRKVKDGEIYFLTNRQNQSEKVEARFRITGKRPQIWNAITGSMEAISFHTEGNQTIVQLEFGPEDAYFVVFRDDTTEPAESVSPAAEQTVASISGPWQVELQPGLGTPETLSLDKLKPLNEFEPPAIRYFSGVATYSTTYSLPEQPTTNRTLWLDLGNIGDVAEVHVNGQAAGITWFPPYRVDISKLLKAGDNVIEVQVANLWVNRLIGDQQPGAEKITFVAAPTYVPDAPLRPSGLLGPVTLIGTVNP